MLTYVQPIIPVNESIKSNNGLICADLIDIAQIKIVDENHLTYQSTVYLGVADLKIRFELFCSSLEYIVFLLSSSLSGFCCLLGFVSFSTGLIVIFSFSVLKHHLITFLFENAYCTFYIIISNLNSHV